MRVPAAGARLGKLYPSRLGGRVVLAAPVTASRAAAGRGCHPKGRSEVEDGAAVDAPGLRRRSVRVSRNAWRTRLLTWK